MQLQAQQGQVGIYFSFFFFFFLLLFFNGTWKINIYDIPDSEKYC